MLKNPLLTVLSALFLVMSLAACGGDPGVLIQGSENPSTLTNGSAGPDNQLVAIEITPADPQIAQNTQIRFTALGTYSDGTIRDITASVTWISSDPDTAEIDEAGASSLDTLQGIKGASSQSSPKFAHGKAIGKTRIDATTGDVTGSTTLTVTSATLISIAVTPENVSIAAETSQQFIATGFFSDNTTQDITTNATWNTSDPGTAGISAGGVAIAIAAGTTDISATSDGVSGSAILTVTEIAASSPPSSDTFLPPASDTSSSTSSAISPVTLSWDAPTTYSDGSPIAAANIQGYKIYFSSTSGAYASSDYFFVAAPATSVVLSDLYLAPGTYYFVVTTLDSSNVESTFSNEVNKDIVIAGQIPQTGWSLEYADSEELVGEDGRAINAFDGNPGTIWHTKWFNGSASQPHEIQINLGALYDISGFKYLPRQDGANGTIKAYEFYVSTDGRTWGTPVATGMFDGNLTEKTVSFAVTTGQYIRLRSLSEINNNPWTSVAEINVLGQ